MAQGHFYGLLDLKIRSKLLRCQIEGSTPVDDGLEYFAPFHVLQRVDDVVFSQPQCLH